MFGIVNVEKYEQDTGKNVVYVHYEKRQRPFKRVFNIHFADLVRKPLDGGLCILN